MAGLDAVLHIVSVAYGQAERVKEGMELGIVCSEVDEGAALLLDKV